MHGGPSGSGAPGQFRCRRAIMADGRAPAGIKAVRYRARTHRGRSALVAQCTLIVPRMVDETSKFVRPDVVA
eukprot:2755533-Prymnesium_polylepis.2